MGVQMEQEDYPLLALRDVVIFPYMVIPLFVGREESILALESAMAREKKILLVSQRDSEIENPQESDLYQIGTIATVVQMLRLEDGTIKVLVEGLCRAKIDQLDRENGFFESRVSILKNVIADKPLIDSLAKHVLSQFQRLVKVNRRIPAELLSSLVHIQEQGDSGRLADSIAAHLTVSQEKRQNVLEASGVIERLQLLQSFLAQEVNKLEVDQRVQNQVEKQIKDNQDRYLLEQKALAIKKQLMESGEEGSEEWGQLKKKIDAAKMPKAVLEKAMSEFDKLKMMPMMSAEATVYRNYLDWLVKLPWRKNSKVNVDLQRAREILDADHYGLEEVKERILEYLAVQSRVGKLRGPILCLVGPPGVGKTSLGQSIADAVGREFVRMSLGGVRDEAEVRGHRRTYIGAMPGKIIQKLAKTKVCNPLFMLDELDKVSSDTLRGDPASALLEVLDPEQNFAFNDHYLEVDYDLSNVMFVATANSLDLPSPLLDRMEIIRIAGYTEEEKLNIATRYLLPKQMERAGLREGELSISESGFMEMIHHYTREAGVRSLEREISKVCRKIVKQSMEKFGCISRSKKKQKLTEEEKISLTNKDIEKYLGVVKYRFGLADAENRVGQVAGLAWTEVGGELLTIESQIIPGKGEFMQTGCLGDVMQESIQAAMTVVKSRADKLKLNPEFFQKFDFHVHVPEGATPKDGPSAGISMATALISAVTQVRVRSDVAMTGEITLRGEVLPIGGLKEKLLAALRAGIRRVIIPKENERELKEFPKNLTQGLEICAVTWIDEVFYLALEHIPDSWDICLDPDFMSMVKSKQLGETKDTRPRH